MSSVSVSGNDRWKNERDGSVYAARGERRCFFPAFAKEAETLNVTPVMTTTIISLFCFASTIVVDFHPFYVF